MEEKKTPGGTSGSASNKAAESKEASGSEAKVKSESAAASTSKTKTAEEKQVKRVTRSTDFVTKQS